jgi:hypothetical protein
MNMKHRWFARTCALLAIALAACGAVQNSDADGSIETWIDAPLNNDSIPLAAYPMVVHANSSQGIDAFEFSVDGQVLGEYPPDPIQPGDGDVTLYSASYDWNPTAPGSYVLSVRPRNNEGVFGPSAVAQVTVIGEYTDLSLFTPEATPEPTAAPTQTPGPTEAAPGFGPPSYSDTQIYWGRRGCNPTDLTVEIMHGDPSVYSLVLFYRYTSTDSSDQTEWSAEAMDPLGDGYYRLNIVPDFEVGDVIVFRKATVDIQIVATDANGDELDRTPVFSDVMLDYCVP